MTFNHLSKSQPPFFTVALMVWTIAEIIRHGVALWAAAVLVYVVLAGVTLWVVVGERVIMKRG